MSSVKTSTLLKMMIKKKNNENTSYRLRKTDSQLTYRAKELYSGYIKKLQKNDIKKKGNRQRA